MRIKQGGGGGGGGGGSNNVAAKKLFCLFMIQYDIGDVISPQIESHELI
jgi:hypothetical protein